MRQRLALIAVEKNNVARFGLLFAQLLGAGPPVPPRFPSDVPSACAGARAPAELFSARPWQFCERLTCAHHLAQASISARRRGIRPVAPVGHRFFQQGGDDAQGGFTLARRRASRDGGLQRCDTAGGEVAAPQGEHVPSQHARNASAILELVQAASVKSTARARSASRCDHVRSARANRPARCSSPLAVTGDFPTMPYTCLQIGAGSEPQKTYPLVSQTESA